MLLRCDSQTPNYDWVMGVCLSRVLDKLDLWTCFFTRTQVTKSPEVLTNIMKTHQPDVLCLQVRLTTLLLGVHVMRRWPLQYIFTVPGGSRLVAEERMRIRAVCNVDLQQSPRDGAAHRVVGDGNQNPAHPLTKRVNISLVACLCGFHCGHDLSGERYS